MSAPQSPAERRFLRPRLRSATLILPRTGERVRKTFTLRRGSTLSNGSTEPLLGPGRVNSSRHGDGGVQEKLRHGVKRAYAFAVSPTGIDILKCSIAYVLGSLATFVPPISGLLGRNDGKHMVATVTVYFHPARSAGSMAQAILLAFGAVIYAAIISFSSMAVSALFGDRNLLVVGHIIVLVVFCGGGLGLVGWTKQRLGNPLVNVACSLASLVLITVLTKEGAVQAATFSYNKVWQVLKMVIMGTSASTAVSLLIRPKWARTEFRDTYIKATDALGEQLTIITRSFLSGSEQDLKDTDFIKASGQSRATFKTLVKNLGEAKYEHYLLGTEKEYKVEARLVKCLELLLQNIGGLRSAAETQFTLLVQSEQSACGTGGEISGPRRANPAHYSDHTTSPHISPTLSHVERRSSILASIEELPESPGEVSDDESLRMSGSWRLPQGMETNLKASDMFSIFIAHLGPPMKSLAYTLREVLDELPFGPGPEYAMMINEHFRTSLIEANTLFANASKDALAAVYSQKVPQRMNSVEVAADFEEVAASCGYFSSSLQDFAEDMVKFLDLLEELKQTRYPRRRSWNWLKFWRRWTGPKERVTDSEESSPTDESIEHELSHEVHNPIQRVPDIQESRRKTTGQRLSYRIWVALHLLRRDDIKYAAKVGIGAMLYAIWSFIPSTRVYYSHWRGEWGLLSYMLVCSMTIGASNTTGLHRFFGTCLGAVYAIICWIIADDHAVVLGVLGWLISLQCFYIIVGKGKGPMGRFILLTYNLSALYAYSLSVQDDDHDDDEGGISPEIWGIVTHRVVAVMTGCVWGLIVTRLIWPISARRRVKQGLSLLWLKMGLVWKRGPLCAALENPTSAVGFMTFKEEAELRRFWTYLDTLRDAATFEFRLKGPFPDKSYKTILEATERLLDSFHAMNVIILKHVNATEGEKEILQYTKKEWLEFSWRISHLFSVMASSMKMAFPMNDVLPNVEHTRDRLLVKVFEFRRTGLGKVVATAEDYELLYAYALVTGQLAHDLAIIGQEIENLYGVLNEDDLKLQ
ncbi:uncharacterized protein EI97DRAFT_387651 [Westerdykella ornata]|uniref:Integral membrane bound transporter domain-containing protein n=1 Tax=Westerdykella ornata TaxID=318751 RepID=A0A6A6J6H7_WESOR|nr:uncharacterized protein EI97DRAFT_387651 [Westerdykella ornata]KAF2271568.1 hypothetical protein EI97DRAFT_387651 [Westerdykella ornata]